jgi:large subunit ribosomal protein L10e
MLTGAGADRMQTGMQLSFGKTAGKAAIVKKDSPIFVFETSNIKVIEVLRKVIKQVRPKLPLKIKVIYERIL